MNMTFRIVLAAITVACLVGVTPAQQPGTPSGRTCATMDRLNLLLQEDPKIADRMAAIEIQTQQIIAAGGGTRNGVVYRIPVVVHVVYNTAAENLATNRVQSQITVLTQDFRRQNPDVGNTPAQFQPVAADTEIEFCLASTDPNGLPTNGITRTQTSVSSFGTNDAVMFTSQGGHNAWPASQYLNIWVCDLSSGLLGYAQFPGGPSATDGVVCDYAYFGNIGASFPFHLGRSCTHEVGHWLNLRHIWGDGPCGVDDLVADTPESDASNFGCPTGHVSCGSTDMVQNYMDYTDDACMNLFTQGQKSRMRALFNPGGARYSLLSSPACGPPVSYPPYQTNQTSASLNINGAVGTSTTPAVTSHCGAASGSINLGSTWGGLYDLAIVFSPLVPSSSPLSIVTSNDQVVNAPVTLPGSTYFLGSNASLPAFIPWPGNYSLPYSTPGAPLLVSLQMIKITASHPDGFALSQGSQLNVASGGGGGGTLPAGPSGDDDFVTVDLSSAACNGSFTYYGTTYNEIHVISNGRIMLGGADTDFGPSVAEITSDNPFFGLWTDLDPASGGSINISSPGASRIRVAYNNVPYYAETTTVTFAIEINTATGAIILDGLQGVPINPVTNASAAVGDRQFLGITRGNAGGTRPAQVVFNPSGSGSSSNSTDAIYNYCNQSAGNSTWHCGGIWLAPSIQAGTDRITFTPLTNGRYTWSAQ